MSRVVRILLSMAFVVSIASSSNADAPASKRGAVTAEQAAANALESKDLNKKGIAMLDAGDLERALDYFSRSRAVLPTSKNTTNAAIVLDRLGRYDASLELYEELLLQYAGGLDDEDRAAIAPAMEALRAKVGSLSLSSNAGGEVFVDGRARGKLPLSTPIRLLGGKHALRVTRVGYAPFESSFEVETGKTTSVEAKLELLAGVGTLVVEDTGGARADVVVDGAKLGTAPWEGALPPGKHLVWLRDGENLGSAPTWVRVIEAQTALTRLQSRKLGPLITVHVSPDTAAFDIDGVALGPGTWQGRLPEGAHVLSASERGYRPSTRRFELQSGQSALDLAVRLEVDPDDPRWPHPRGRAFLEAFGGAVVGPTLSGGYASECPDHCDSVTPAYGFVAGARGGYRFRVGIGIEIAGGYMSIRQKVRRTETSAFGADATKVTYRLADDAHVHGPFFGIGASWRADIGRLLYGGTRATVGVLVASSGDPISGTASTTGPAAPVFAEKNAQTFLSVAPYVAPELFGGVHAGPVEIGLSFSASFFPAQGPVMERGRFGAKTSGSNSDPAAVENSPESAVLDGERSYGRFVVFVPAVTFGATF